MKLYESPDFIGDDFSAEDPAYGDSDSVTFALFDNFYLWSNNPDVNHGHLFEYLVGYIRHNLKPSSENSKNKLKINHIGKLKETEVNNFKKIEKVDRSPVLEVLPQVLQGRLWKNSKIISFWNDLVYIASRKKDIIKFINIIGENAPLYRYEIKNKLYNYEDFISGKYSDNLKFDPGVVHTLSPDKKGDMLKKMGIVPKQPIPLQFRQMIQGESFKNWLKSNK